MFLIYFKFIINGSGWVRTIDLFVNSKMHHRLCYRTFETPNVCSLSSIPPPDSDDETRTRVTRVKTSCDNHLHYNGKMLPTRIELVLSAHKTEILPLN